MKLHTKSSGFITCHICTYQMEDKELVKDHVKKHSKVSSKQCVICDEGESENFDLKKHVQKNVSLNGLNSVFGNE